MVLSEKAGHTSVILSTEERKFLNQHGVGPTEIIVQYIRRQKDIINGLVVDNVITERTRADNLFKVCEELKKRCYRLQDELDELKKQ